MKRNLRKEFKNAKEIIEAEEIGNFDYIYFEATKRKHDSGYYIFNIYGQKNKIFYRLSKISDVIDFEKIAFKFNWFVSIDIPEKNIFRIFSRNDKEINIPFKNCSSFIINIIGD